jgi:hypothetical protein
MTCLSSARWLDGATGPTSKSQRTGSARCAGAHETLDDSFGLLRLMAAHRGVSLSAPRRRMRRQPEIAPTRLTVRPAGGFGGACS